MTSYSTLSTKELKIALLSAVARGDIAAKQSVTSEIKSRIVQAGITPRELTSEGKQELIKRTLDFVQQHETDILG